MTCDNVLQLWSINDPLFLDKEEATIPVMNGMKFVDGEWINLTTDDICERLDDIFEYRCSVKELT